MLKKYILSSLSIVILLFQYILLYIGILEINLYSKTTTILLIISSIILLIISLVLYFSRKINHYNIGVVLALILNIIVANSIYKLNKEYLYITNVITDNYIYKEYNIYVQKKNTTYSDISKLNNKKIGLLNNEKNIKNHIDKKINIEYIKYDSITEIEEAITNGEIQSFIISENEEFLLEKDELNNKVRIIYSNKIKDTKK